MLTIRAKAGPALKSVTFDINIPDELKKEGTLFFELYKKQSGQVEWLFVGSSTSPLDMEDVDILYELKPGVSIDYKLVVKRMDTMATLDIAMNTLSLSPNFNRYALVAETNYERVLEVADAPYFKVYHVSSMGEHCPICWDDIREESNNPNCEVCAGTGFSSGFVYRGRIRLVLLNSNKSESAINETIINGVIRPNPMQAWTNGKIILRPKYVIVREFNNTAYEILNVSPSLIGERLVRQEVIYREIEQGDPIYDHIERSELYG